MTSISPQLHRGFGLQFWVTAITTMGIIFFTYMHPVLQNFQQGYIFLQGYHNELISKAFSSDTLSACAPILAGIPFSAGYLEDVKSKFSRFVLVRGSYSGYLLGHAFVCWLSGSLALLLGAACAYGLTTLVFLPLEWVTENPPDLGPTLAGQFLLHAFNGGLWAVIGMAMSTIMESKYIAYASPFILYYLLVILYERYFPKAYLLYPKNCLNPEIWPYGLWSGVLFLLEITMLFAILFYVRGKRRLEQL